MNSAVKTLFALLAALALPMVANAADPLPEMYNARALALGGAVASIPGKTMSARANPAALVPQRGYWASATYLNRNDNQLDAVGVTVVDNSSSPIAGAFNYLRVVSEGENEEAALSLAAGAEGIYYGATGRFVHTRTNRNADWESTFLGDIGMLLLSDSGFALGLVGRDLLDSSYEVLERRVAAGISSHFENGLLISIDCVRFVDREVKKGATTHFGIEWRPDQTNWALRGGYMFDAMSNDEYYSTGLGWTNQRIEFAYAFRQHTEYPKDAIHTVSFSTPF